MNQPFVLNSDKARHHLEQAVELASLAVLSYRHASGWEVVKTKFLDINAASRRITLENPPQKGSERIAMVPGQHVCVSFRRGHKKCVFTTHFEQLGETYKKTERVELIRLLWPEQIYELQRRLYYRAPVPDDMVIMVELFIQRHGIKTAANGEMLDLSAGGMSVMCPKCTEIPWEVEDAVTCRFRPLAGRNTIEVTGQIRHLTPLPDGRTRVGLQFVGLETNREGLFMLQQIALLGREFIRCERMHQANQPAGSR